MYNLLIFFFFFFFSFFEWVDQVEEGEGILTEEGIIVESVLELSLISLSCFFLFT